MIEPLLLTAGAGAGVATTGATGAGATCRATGAGAGLGAGLGAGGGGGGGAACVSTSTREWVTGTMGPVITGSSASRTSEWPSTSGATSFSLVEALATAPDIDPIMIRPVVAATAVALVAVECWAPASCRSLRSRLRAALRSPTTCSEPVRGTMLAGSTTGSGSRWRPRSLTAGSAAWRPVGRADSDMGSPRIRSQWQLPSRPKGKVRWEGGNEPPPVVALRLSCPPGHDGGR